MTQGLKRRADIEQTHEYGSGDTATEVFMGPFDLVYLLTLSGEDGWTLIGIFLDPEDAKKAKTYLTLQGLDPMMLDIEQAPKNVVNLHGVESPYIEGPVH